MPCYKPVLIRHSTTLLGVYKTTHIRGRCQATARHSITSHCDIKPTCRRSAPAMRHTLQRYVISKTPRAPHGCDHQPPRRPQSISGGANSPRQTKASELEFQHHTADVVVAASLVGFMHELLSSLVSLGNILDQRNSILVADDIPEAITRQDEAIVGL